MVHLQTSESSQEAVHVGLNQQKRFHGPLSDLPAVCNRLRMSKDRDIASRQSLCEYMDIHVFNTLG